MQVKSKIVLTVGMSQSQINSTSAYLAMNLLILPGATVAGSPCLQKLMTQTGSAERLVEWLSPHPRVISDSLSTRIQLLIME